MTGISAAGLAIAALAYYSIAVFKREIFHEENRMEKTLDFIWRRRSVREFTGAPVTEEQVQSLLEAAMAAPSACCKDPWEFIVLREKEMLKAVSECLPNGHFLAKAPLGIIVCGDIRQAHSENLSYLLQDCAAATENLLLAASALGLGACWLGIHPREERITALRKLFHFPEHLIPFGGIAVGVPAAEVTPRTRFNPAKVHNAPEWKKQE